jgi:hypothetical protein
LLRRKHAGRANVDAIARVLVEAVGVLDGIGNLRGEDGTGIKQHKQARSAYKISDKEGVF